MDISIVIYIKLELQWFVLHVFVKKPEYGNGNGNGNGNE